MYWAALTITIFAGLMTAEIGRQSHILADPSAAI